MRELIKKMGGKQIKAKLIKIVTDASIRNAVKIYNQNYIDCPAENHVDFLFSNKAKYIRPWQIKEEFMALAKEIEIKKPKVVLEIGTASGGSLFLATRLATDDALIISIDLPEGLFGGGYPEWKIPLYKSFQRCDQKIELIRGDSHSEGVFDQCKTVLNGRTIDYCFLDGDHSYEGVKSDFELYGQLLSPDAIVAFHDIVSDKEEVPDHFVSVFWDEVKDNYMHKEFVKDRFNQSKLGIGLLFIKQ